MHLLPPEILTLVFLAGVRAQSGTSVWTYTPGSSAVVVSTATGASDGGFSGGVSNDIGAPTTTFTTDAPATTFTTDTPTTTPTTDDPPLPTDAIYPCDLADPPDWCEPPPPFWHPEETATGWDDWGSWNNDGIGGGNNIAPPAPTPTPTVRTVGQSAAVVTVVTPTVVGVRTSVDGGGSSGLGGGVVVQPQAPNTDTVSAGGGQQGPSAQITFGQDAPQTTAAGGGSVGGGGGRGGGSVPQGQPVQPTPPPGQTTAGSTVAPGNAPALWQSASTGNALLDTIINHLGKPQPGAQPAQPTSPTTKPSTEHPTQDLATPPTDTKAPIAPSEESTHPQPASPEPNTTPLGNSNSNSNSNTLVLGSATLSLTPGLSTTLGTGTQTTLIAIQTNAASQTLITISSSGTAVTATITQAPATVTLPRTGFEASITPSVGVSRGAGTAVGTSSRGVAAERGFRGLSVVLGVLALL